MCLKAFSPANGGARPEAMLRASGHLTAWPAYNQYSRLHISLVFTKMAKYLIPSIAIPRTTILLVGIT